MTRSDMVEKIVHNMREEYKAIGEEDCGN